jgi:phenylacetate-CoA ligase
MRASRLLTALDAYLNAELDEVLAWHTELDPALEALALFQEVASEVPAYREFLRGANVDPARVTTVADFQALPVTNKQNYHQAFRLAALCRGGALDASDIIAVSSGSTGRPTFWPRSKADEFGTSFRFEQVLRDGFGLGRARTLGVVCFALGSWVGGMYTTAACRNVAAKGYPLTLVTPGNHPAEILRLVRELGPEFEELVLFGYPPFLKDVIDAGRADGLDWGARPVRLVTAGEVFSEAWRSLVLERLGQADPARHTASLYGTADGGVLANETPLSIRIRRFLAENTRATRDLFGESRLPTLCQYDPLHRYFERVGEHLVFTGEGGVPLIRYDILDRGGVIPAAAMQAFLGEHGFDVTGAGGEGPMLPFVYVFGRTGFALSFYGANVYPENVAVGLEQGELASSATGKFVMQLVTTGDEDVEFEVVVELARGVESSEALLADVRRSLRTHIERQNGEYASYVPDAKRTPRVRLLPHAEPTYFPSGVKHRYTR